MLLPGASKRMFKTLPPAVTLSLVGRRVSMTSSTIICRAGTPCPVVGCRGTSAVARLWRAQPPRPSGTSLSRIQGCLLPSCLSKSHRCSLGNYLLYLDLVLRTKARRHCRQIPVSCPARSPFSALKLTAWCAPAGKGKQIQKNVFSILQPRVCSTCMGFQLRKDKR